MNWVANSSSASDDAILADINRKNTILLLPVILYTAATLIVGTVGNPIAIYIYGWRWPHTTTRWFLLWLACFDLLNCINTMPTEIYFLTSLYYIPNGNFCRMSRFLTYLINNSTAVVFVFISIDRYIRICRPHRFPMSISGAKIACTVSLLIGAAGSWPALFLYGRKEVRMPTKSSSRGYVLAVMCSIRNEMDSTPYPIAFFIYLCCGVSACFLILVILYVLIGCVILKRHRARELRNSQIRRKFLGGDAPTNSVAINKGQLSEQAVFSGDQPTRSESRSTTQLSEQAILSGDPPIRSEPRNNAQLSEQAILSGDPPTRSESRDNAQLSEQAVLSGDPPTKSESRNNAQRNEQAVLMNISSLKALKSKLIRLPKSTLMVFAITIVFVLTFLPFLIIIIVRQHVGPSFYPSLSPTKQVVVHVFAKSYLVNNCANPIIYGLCNTQFSAEVRKLFTMHKSSRHSSMSRKETYGSELQISHMEPET